MTKGEAKEKVYRAAAATLRNDVTGLGAMWIREDNGVDLEDADVRLVEAAAMELASRLESLAETQAARNRRSPRPAVAVTKKGPVAGETCETCGGGGDVAQMHSDGRPTGYRSPCPACWSRKR